ncbi:MAG: Zeta toxin [uncultured bacterium (gcode 4)]|uniref:Zeta toxin n=1 Tax=uncultured bacterium (gcode 4) TaxID=1234023 RepID=K2GCX1_9BACT|nr:MAG: Zeta toxin [uncultured bacterium (gcode 4)]
MKWTKDKLHTWAKENRNRLARDFFKKKNLAKSDEKIAIFMAWSPWAGKTEFINRLLTEDQKAAYYILDLDEIRTWMPNYKWNYADKYTKGAIKILEKLFDVCAHNEYNFILDWTFTSTDVIDRNIDHLLRKWYKINVFYIHTQPYISWIYTLLRWNDDNRRIPWKKFIKFYHDAFSNIHIFQEKYSWKITFYISQKIRDIDWYIIHDDKYYLSNSIQEMNDIFDNKVRFYYNLWKDLLNDTLYFQITKIISFFPIIWKPLLRHIAKIPKWQ